MTTASPILLLLLLATGALGQSCQDRCGDYDANNTCQCNDLCVSIDDCCDDFDSICLTCQDRCGEVYLYSKPCQCTYDCSTLGNCCDDFTTLCGTGTNVTDAELVNLAEELYAAEVNSVYSQLTLDLQGLGDTGDLAPGPLFVTVPDTALSGPTISLLIPLLDNYYPDISLTEDQDALEIEEQNAFLDAITSTEVMQTAEAFLQSKNLLTGSLRDKLDEIWFTLYDRGGVASSSGFEHVFVGELDDAATQVLGFHNWVTFQKEESEGDLNYLGYTDLVTIGSKTDVVMPRFEWMGVTEDVSSMFVGTSPELEIAIYTVCFLARPDALCPVQMSGEQFHVDSDTIFGIYVESAHPER